MSNLTSASNDQGISISSSGNRDEQSQPSIKRKRNLPGNPDPEAEVIALSPGALLATNRFICEVCNKGFQRDQNLQLHRRGHNLPWKLKKRSNQEGIIIRKKVYVCPEVTCVHHHPSRALGDLTGIKKHFCRKHGEKKWKCEKCSKRYAVQSDWKAHSKICGTREYRCDCGTIFSRRDSFITHRAFCDALPEENSIRGAFSTNHDQFQYQIHMSSHNLSSPSSLLFPQLKTEQLDLPQETFFNSSRPQTIIMPEQHRQSYSYNPNNNHPIISSSFQPDMSATALLQKAAQMAIAVTKMPPPSHHHDHQPETTSILRPHQVHMITETAAAGSGSLQGLYPREENNMGEYGFIHDDLASMSSSFGTHKSIVTPNCMELHDVIISATHHHHRQTSPFSSNKNFEERVLDDEKRPNINKLECGNEGGLTRDFLSLRALIPNTSRDQCDLFMPDLQHQIGNSSYEHHHKYHQS
ncbi:hypothetical protein M9H77_19551 [Catharanthus roseus]|uniref:Uncharacterized protein n=1 Tax=Catharanthus roseus TaxID=4058 RepID=A0ACC0BAX4_CATRO|nr:hypothetical protein M9H77_19551 [Catharanthus roseus]